MKMRFLLAVQCVLALNVLGMPGQSPLAADKLDEAVALVDDDVVLKSELDRRVATVRQDLSRRGVRMPPDEVLREQVLERLIVDAVQLQHARRAGVRVADQELAGIIENIARENQVSLEQFRLQLAADGINFEIFRDDIRNEVMVSRLRQAQVSRRIFISEQEVDSMLKSMDSEGAERISYRLGHILIPIAESASPQDVQQASALADDIVKQLRSGADFAEMAVRHSAAQDALQGGDFGWKTLNQLPSLFAPAVKALKPAEVSEPLRSASGLHILKLYDSRGAERVVVRQSHARHILIKPSQIRTEEQAKKFISELREQIIKGADFAALAKAHSDDPGSANLGGDLGWANPGKFVPEFESTLEKLADNEVSEVFRSQFGWHVMQLLGRRDDDQTEEAKRNQAYRLLQNRKYDEEVEAWVRELRDEAYVRILIDEKKKG